MVIHYVALEIENSNLPCYPSLIMCFLFACKKDMGSSKKKKKCKKDMALLLLY